MAKEALQRGFSLPAASMAHAMGAHVAEFKARAMADTSCGSHPGSVASANVRGAFAVNRRGALAMGRGALAMGRRALAMNLAEVLRMHCRLA